MVKSVSDIKSIVFTGGSVVISACDYTISDLKSIVFVAKSHNAKIIIKNADKLTTNDCKSIAFSNGGCGNVFFDFTK